MTTVSVSISAPKIPSWATGFGQDEYGYFADWSVNTSDPLGGRFISQRMRWIPPGEFVMGSAPDEHSRATDEIQHRVSLTQGFWLGETVVSQELWKVFFDKNPSHFLADDLPVECVSFDEVQIFLQAVNEQFDELNLTLPTEAQWEYACRAGAETPYSFGATLTTEQANFDGNFPYQSSDPKGEFRKKTVPVRFFKPNRWGVFQMHGNVWEWCLDWYGEYDVTEVVDPKGPDSGSGRVLRGGSWITDARGVRSADRGPDHPGHRYGIVGFRCLSSV